MACAVVGLASRGSRADEIVIHDRSYAAGKVVDFREGRVKFARATGQELSPWVDEVKRLTVDESERFADFNMAEELQAAGKIDAAVEAYYRAQAYMKGYWPELIEARILHACNSRPLDGQAARAFIRVVNGDVTATAVAARLFPDKLPESIDEDVNRGVMELGDAAAQASDPDRKAMFDFLRYGVLAAAGDDRAEGLRQRIVQVEVPRDARTDEIFAIKLGAMRAWLAEGKSRSLAEPLDDAIRHCTHDLLSGYLILKGDMLLADARDEEDLVRASWAFMRIPIHLPDDPRAPEGLLRTAQVLQRINRPAKARQLAEECLAHEHVGEGVRRGATALIEEIGER